MSAKNKDANLDRIMDLVGNDGKFQRFYNNFYNVMIAAFASMNYMNIVLALSEPEHTCRVPGRENYNLTVGEWLNLTIPNLTTLPLALFALWNKYTIESPLWLASKGHLGRCANELNRIAKINGKDVVVTERMVRELVPKDETDKVYGMLSLFTHWRLAKNTIMVIICWSNASIMYLILMLNATRMGGNPFLGFFYQSAIELPSLFIGQYLADKIGRRYSNAMAMLFTFVACIPVLLIAHNKNSEILVTCLTIAIKFCSNVSIFVSNLQSAEVYPTCLRQSGVAAGVIVSNCLSVVAPYIVYLGTEYDVRYPYVMLGVLGLIGFSAAMFLPETLYCKLPNTMSEAIQFGKDQTFWFIPRKPEEATDTEMESLKPSAKETHDIFCEKA